MNQGYLDLIDCVLSQGVKQSPRGMGTYEIENATVVLEDPRQAMPQCVGRKLSKKILAAESMQWLAGVSDLEQLASASRQKFKDYSDDGTRLYGAYGPRAYEGLRRAVRLLAEDPDSRQAVVSLWNNIEAEKTKDLPCTLSWAFRIRDGKLNMSTVMRSWDVWTGTTYDLPAMTRIQSAVAWALDVPVGTYVHTAHSLHIYESNMEAASNLVAATTPAKHPPMLGDDLAFEMESMNGVITSEMTPSDRWELIVDLAENTLRNPDDWHPPSFQWFAAELKGLNRNPHFCNDCRYYLPSGELFCNAKR